MLDLLKPSQLVKLLKINQKRRSVSVLVLTYILLPEAQCPTPLKGIVAALSYLIDDTRRRLSNIINARDSAGGNLTMPCTSHLQHSHPRVPVVVKLEAPPRGGLALTSPRASFWTDYPSFANEAFGVVTPGTLRK
jgi:acetyl esterase/lipase